MVDVHEESSVDGGSDELVYRFKQSDGTISRVVFRDHKRATSSEALWEQATKAAVRNEKEIINDCVRAGFQVCYCDPTESASATIERLENKSRGSV